MGKVRLNKTGLEIENKNSSFNRITLIFLFVIILLCVNFSSAFEFDNIMDYDVDTEIIVIENAFGLGEDLVKAQLTDNFCIDRRFCEADKTITLYNGGQLIEDWRTLRVDDDSWEEQDIRSHKFEYWGMIDDYETQCYDSESIYSEINDSYYTERICEKVKLGEHEGWIEFYIGDIFDAGVYKVRTTGEIKPGNVYDWQIKIAGKWTTPWEIWGEIGIGGATAEVILNSPADDSIFYNNPVTFNASANVTGGAYITNMSLWTNETGSWTMKNISDSLFLNESTGEVLSSCGPASNARGEEIQIIRGDIIISSISKVSSSTATNCQIRDNDTLAIIASGTYSGNNCIFSPITLENGSNYYLQNYGGSFTRCAFTSGSSYPYIGEKIKWISAVEGDINGFPDIQEIDSIYSLQTTYTKTFNRTIYDDIVWNYKACDSDGDCGFAPSNFSLLIDTSAPNIAINSGSGIQNYGSVDTNHTINFTSTDTNLDSCWLSYNGTNTSVSCSSGVSSEVSFPIVKDLYSATIYSNDTIGNINSSLVTWSYKVFENNMLFIEDTFETEDETYTINVTANSSLSSIVLNYNGTNYTMSQSGNLWSKSFDVPQLTADENRSLYFLFFYVDEIIQSDTSYQYVRNWNLSYSNPYQYINVSIYDEETYELLNLTTLQSLIDYYSGSGTNYLIFSDSEEQDGIYEINISNSSVGDVAADTTFTFSRTGYQQRNYYNTFLLTNSTIQNVNLYLLLSDAGILNIFDITENGLLDISGATIRAYKIDGVNEYLVDSAVTDDSGQGILFLDPNYLHRISVSKDECTTVETNKYPTGGTTEISLSCAGEDGELSINKSLYEGLTIDFSPTTTNIQNGTQEFSVNIDDSDCDLSNSYFSLIIGGTTVNSTTGTSPCGEELSLFYNPENGSIKSYVKITKNATDLYSTKIYYVLNTNTLISIDKSLWDILIEFQDQDFFGLSNTSKTFISFIVIFLIVGGLSITEGVKADSVGTLILVEILISLFSLLGWLNLGLLPATTPYYDFLNKFSIAILGSMFLAGIIMLKSEK